MKKILLLIFGVIVFTSAFSQDFQDVIYLKNGSVIKGIIIKQEPGSETIIKTNDGQLYSYLNQDIEQVLREYNFNLDEYEGDFSYGFSLGGGGLIGFPIRFHPSEKFAFEMSLNYRPSMISVDNYWGETETYFEHSVVFGLATNFYFKKKFKSTSQKVKLNGITLNAGVGTGGYEILFFGGGWIHESFKKFNYKKSFTLELGPGILYTWFNDGYSDLNAIAPIIYWKVQWNWFR
jgi:hypothetical protein